MERLLPLHKKAGRPARHQVKRRCLETSIIFRFSLGQSQSRKQPFSEVAYTPDPLGRKYGYLVSALHSHCRGSERQENCPVDSFQRRTGGSPGPQGFDSPMLHSRRIKSNRRTFSLFDFGEQRSTRLRSVELGYVGGRYALQISLKDSR